MSNLKFKLIGVYALRHTFYSSKTAVGPRLTFDSGDLVFQVVQMRLEFVDFLKGVQFKIALLEKILLQIAHFFLNLAAVYGLHFARLLGNHVQIAQLGVFVF